MKKKPIDVMVDRFLGWKLPDDFAPDGGISFKREFNEHMAHPMKHEPVGTNLLTAEQAKEMIEYVIDGQIKCPVPELEGTLPVVLYFGTEEDRDEFIAAVQEVKPGMVARKL